MRWKCVALLVTVVTLTSGQDSSIDRDINAIATPKPAVTLPSEQLRDIETEQTDTTTNEDNSADEQLDENNSRSDNNVDVNQETEIHLDDDDTELGNESTDDDNTDDAGNETDDDGNDQDNDFVNTTEGQETNESGQENDTDDDNNGTTPESNESGGEQSVEAVQPVSNENAVSRSDEYQNTEELEDIVEIEGGSVQGYFLHGDTGIRSYIDIPYGAFSGLFMAPTKATPWNYVLENREHTKRCPQIDENGDYVGDMECLTLSVFAPKDIENAPVLFHIYDGDFNIGSADQSIYGPEYLVTKGIILVLPNYRLGALGFLCLNNEIAPGNAGLKDLTEALEWTRSNIEHFGGDPSKIFVSGDGSSGALAGYLALSPTSRQYLSGVITESGSILAPWAIDRNPENSASLLRLAIQSDITNELEPEVLVTAAKDISFRPCIENGNNAFINETPWQILQNEDVIIDIPFMIGSANHAGLKEAMTHTAESLLELNENFYTFLPDDLKFENGEEKDVAEKIKKLYFGDEDVGLEHIEHLSLCYTDAYYLGPSIRASRALIRAGAKVYFYEFSFVGDLNRMLAGLSSTVQGAVKGDIIGYTFTQDGQVAEEGSSEESVVHLITDLWISFLQTGVPSNESAAWNNLENVAESEEQWLSIDREAQPMTGLHEDRLALWTQVYDNHFIEKNLAVEIQSSLHLIVAGILMLILRNF